MPQFLVPATLVKSPLENDKTMFERRNQEKCLRLSSQRLINERQVGRIFKKSKVCEAQVPPPTHRGRSPFTAFSIVFIRILEEEPVLVSHIPHCDSSISICSTKLYYSVFVTTSLQYL